MSKKTECTVCGTLLTYTTKKPLKCAKCKKPKSGRKRSFPKNTNTSGELLLFSVLNEVIIGQEYINHGYYSFMLSPKNQPLQLDRYYPDLRLAFEYDGQQHDKYIKYIHKSRKNFTYQKECDKIKDKECKANDITLIRISHTDKINEDLIKQKIKEANKKLYDRMKRDGSLNENS